MAVTSGTWAPIDRIGLNQAIDSNSTTQNHKIGETVKCRDIGSTNYGDAEFVYLGGLDATTLGMVVCRDGDITLLATARSVGQVAVAMSACVTGEYGWYQVAGKAKVKAGTVADDKQVYLTATPGSIDDAVVAGDMILGMRTAGATDTGFALCVLDHPNCGDIDNT